MGEINVKNTSEWAGTVALYVVIPGEFNFQQLFIYLFIF